MKLIATCRSTLLLGTAALVVACSGEPRGEDEVRVGVESSLAAQHTSAAPSVAPPELVLDGSYSDVRFCDMMAAHHRHAIDMAEVELERGSDEELRAMARDIIAMQTKEIEELATIKQSLTGSRELPTKMHPHQMQNGGVPMPDELVRGTSVDLAFLDGMLPHHSGAVLMSSAALRYTGDARIADVARRAIDAQAKEIGDLGGIRKARSPGARHGFPHAK